MGRITTQFFSTAGDFAKGNNVNDGNDGSDDRFAICVDVVDDAFFFSIFGGLPPDPPLVVLLAFLAALSDGGWILACDPIRGPS